MRRIISLLIIAVLSWSLFDGVLFAQRQKSTDNQEPETKVIDLTADIVYPITLNDTVEVMCLVGDFAAQHNGAIITADSAVRYSDKRIECFGNVLINKNTTYAYADRADYNGELNEMQLYAPIIKVVDEGATLYCYNFRFNTLDNIGQYDGGGIMINGENIMESVTGYYYSDTKELIGVGNVELSGDEYQMTSDSMIYNTQTEAAQYFTNTNIWNKKDEYLYADAGDYDKATDRYSFSQNGYILTKEQEMWSDSMDYYRASEHIYMRQNIQIDDTTQKSLIFGNYGEYIKDPGNMILVGKPSIVNYDLEQGDSLFMRADTFEIFTLQRPLDSMALNSVADTSAMTALTPEQPLLEEDHTGHTHAEGEHHDHDHSHDHGEQINNAAHSIDTHNNTEAAHATNDRNSNSFEELRREAIERQIGVPDIDIETAAKMRADSISESINRDNERIAGGVTPQSDNTEGNQDSSTIAADSISRDSLSADSVQLDSTATAKRQNLWQRTKTKYLEARKERQAKKAIEDAARKVVLDSIGHARQLIINKKLDAEKIREARQVATRKARLAEKQLRKLRRDVARGKVAAADTAAIISGIAVDTTALIKELANIDSVTVDSTALIKDTIAIADSTALAAEPVDSLYKLTKGYRNVKIYRSDFQTVADSMATNSMDSIIKLYHNPILWHENNQVTSDVMDIYTDNNQIKKAVFTEGTPIMASEVEPKRYYNQISGKVITSLFAEGSIYRTDADGNAQTIYFMQDDETKEVDGLMVMESGSATFYIEDQQMVGITYRGDPNYTLYPMDMIPSDQGMSLKGFSWQSELRPTQAMVFERWIRPSQREEKSAIPQPMFPLYEELNRHKKELIDAGLWGERNEVVSPQAEEWMESLGYKTGQPREEQK